MERPDATDQRARRGLAEGGHGHLEQLALEIGIGQGQLGVALSIGLQVQELAAVTQAPVLPAVTSTRGTACVARSFGPRRPRTLAFCSKRPSNQIDGLAATKLSNAAGSLTSA